MGQSLTLIKSNHQTYSAARYILGVNSESRETTIQQFNNFLALDQLEQYSNCSEIN